MNEKFLLLISKLRDPLEFLGICNLLGVKPEEGQDFEDLLYKVTGKFAGKPRKKKKEILKLLAEVVKEVK